MTCRIVKVNSIEESHYLQLTAFYLGYNWIGTDNCIMEESNCYLLFYSEIKDLPDPFITKSHEYVSIGARSKEPTIELTIEEFSQLTKEQV